MSTAHEITKHQVSKSTGIEWIGEIPAHWSLLRNKNIFRLKKKLVGKRSNEYELLSLTLRGIVKRNMENPEGKFPAEFDTYQEVCKGNFVFCLFDVEETPRTVGLSQYDGMITGAYTVFECSDDFDPNYLYYFYLNLDMSKRLKPLYKGLRNTIPKDVFFNFVTFAPPLQEQKRIAKFIHDKNREIEDAIDRLHTQIGNLKEYRTTLVNSVVMGNLKVT